MLAGPCPTCSDAEVTTHRSGRRAVIDLGSATINLLVADVVRRGKKIRLNRVRTDSILVELGRCLAETGGVGAGREALSDGMAGFLVGAYNASSVVVGDIDLPHRAGRPPGRGRPRAAVSDHGPHAARTPGGRAGRARLCLGHPCRGPIALRRHGRRLDPDRAPGRRGDRLQRLAPTRLKPAGGHPLRPDRRGRLARGRGPGRRRRRRPAGTGRVRGARCALRRGDAPGAWPRSPGDEPVARPAPRSSGRADREDLGRPLASRTQRHARRPRRRSGASPDAPTRKRAMPSPRASRPALTPPVSARHRPSSTRIESVRTRLRRIFFPADDVGDQQVDRRAAEIDDRPAPTSIVVTSASEHVGHGPASMIGDRGPRCVSSLGAGAGHAIAGRQACG